MRSVSVRVLSIGLLCAAAVPTDPVPAIAQGASVAPSQAPVFRVIRSTSGSKGQIVGQTFVVDDPRTVFRVPDDRQVIVHFEWAGPPGVHRMEGLWRNPEGRVATISDFSHTSSGPRFGAYWELALPATAVTGTWTLEARIDGQPAGTHRFEIVTGSGAVAGPVSIAPAKAHLSSQELYARIQAATVTIQKLDAAGRAGLTASAFAIAKDRVALPFHLVDGAAAIRLTSTAGQTETVTHVAAFDRAGDWALLPTTLALQPLARPATREAGVGSTLYGLNVAPTGERTFVDAAIGGTSTRPVLGERLLLSVPVGWRTAGTPVMDSQGQVVAIAGAVWDAGTAYHDEDGARALAPASAIPLHLGGSSLAIPIERVVDAGAPPRPLSALAAEVPFSPMFGPSREHLIRGLTGQSMKRATPYFEVVDLRTSFSKATGEFALVLELMPRSKLNGLPVGVTIHTVAGRALATIKPASVKGEANRPMGLGWTLDANALQPGIYRLDVGAPGDLMWRTFIEITP